MDILKNWDFMCNIRLLSVRAACGSSYMGLKRRLPQTDGVILLLPAFWVTDSHAQRMHVLRCTKWTFLNNWLNVTAHSKWVQVFFESSEPVESCVFSKGNHLRMNIHLWKLTEEIFWLLFSCINNTLNTITLYGFLPTCFTKGQAVEHTVYWVLYINKTPQWELLSILLVH